jgi:hypothetical protein
MSKTRLYSGLIATSAGFILSSLASAQVDPNFHVYLAFGQSNMEGNAKTFGSNDKVSVSRFKVLGATTCSDLQRTKDQWSPGIAPLFRCATGLSPADYFARTLVDSLASSIKIGIVPVAVAGTAIAGFDDRAYKAYYEKQASWMVSIANEYGGNPYGRLVAMAKIAQQTGVIKGIIFHQGETDAYNAAWRDTVKYIYNKLLTDLSLKAADVPFLAGQVVGSDQSGQCAGANTTIDALPKTIPTSYVISSKGLPDGGDKLHFSAASYREFGKRYAQQMLKLLPKSSAIAPSNLAANLTNNAHYAIYDVKGTRLTSFHATDAASVESAWTGIRKSLPNGIYWIKNGSTGAAQRVLAGR